VLDVAAKPPKSPLATRPNIGYKCAPMKLLRATLAACLAVFCLTGCLQVEKVVKLNADGSGTIEETLIVPKTALATLQQMAGAGGKPFDLFDEAKFKDAASQMGEGVTLASAKKLSSDAGEGFTATFAFTDINKLKLDQNPIEVMPGPVGPAGSKEKKEPIVFHFTKGSPSELSVAMPPPAFKPKAPQAPGAEDMAMQMMRQMLKDMKITFALEVPGKITETNAEYHDELRVTFMDVDFNKVMDDQAKFKALATANPQTMQDAKALIKGLDGVKIETAPEVKIKFQ
jgi:hypothetical protein